MDSDETPGRYPYLISVRGGRPVPARRDGSYYVCAYPTFLGLWWPPREVKVLDYDPHRDFYREQRQAYLAAHPEAAPASTARAPAASGQPTAPAPAAGGQTGPGLPEPVSQVERAPTLFERVDSGPAARPAPPGDAARRSPRPPGIGR